MNSLLLIEANKQWDVSRITEFFHLLAKMLHLLQLCMQCCKLMLLPLQKSRYQQMNSETMIRETVGSSRRLTCVTVQNQPCRLCCYIASFNHPSVWYYICWWCCDWWFLVDVATAVCCSFLDIKSLCENLAFDILSSLTGLKWNQT